MHHYRLIFCALVASASAIVATATPEISASAEGAYVSRYVFRGVKLGAAAFQPTVNVAVANIDFGFWANQPSAGDENVERDYSTGYSFAQLGCDWRLGAQVYTYPQAEAPLTEKSYEFSLSGNRSLWKRDLHELALNGAVFYDIRLDALTLETSLMHTMTPCEGLCLCTSIVAGHTASYDLAPDDLPPKVADAYAYAAAKIEAKITVAKQGYVRVGGQWDTTKGLNTGDLDISGNVSCWIALGWEW